MSEPDGSVHNPTAVGNGWPPERVKALRAALRLNQKQFADAVGVSRPTVSAWEQAGSIKSMLNAAALERLERGAPIPQPPAPSAALFGRAIEVEALMAFALERQRLLVQALAGATTQAAPTAEELARLAQLLAP